MGNFAPLMYILDWIFQIGIPAIALTAFIYFGIVKKDKKIAIVSLILLFLYSIKYILRLIL